MRTRLCIQEYRDGIKVTTDIGYHSNADSVTGATGQLAFCRVNPDRITKVEKAGEPARFFLQKIEKTRSEFSEIPVKPGQSPVQWRWQVRVDFPDGSAVLDTVYSDKAYFGESENPNCVAGFDLGPTLSTSVKEFAEEPAIECVKTSSDGYKILTT